MRSRLVGVLVLAGLTASVIHLVRETLQYGFPADLQPDPHSQSSRVRVGDANTNISWFVHLTDIHLSKFQAPDRTDGFLRLTEDLLKFVQPAAVVVTGDLTDAKNIDYTGSRQYKEEWIDYSVAVELAKNRTVWLDIRGNHDNFDVPGLDHRENYFKEFSSQGKAGNLGSYLRIVHSNGIKLGFLALDATLKPHGPRRPFNFVGALNQAELDELEVLAQQAREQADVTIWFGHYPTSMIVSPEPGPRDLMADGLIYLCGHLHNLHGLGDTMEVRHRSGLREAELTDWMHGRMLRLLAVDHGVLSWRDLNAVSGLSLPVVLVTWPPGGLRAGDREPVHLIHTSTHIRLLVFTKSSHVKVRVGVDTETLRLAETSDGRLYTVSWKPQIYTVGVHHIHVEVEESGHTILSESHSFSLDGTSMTLPFIGQVVLLVDLIAIFQLCFILMVCLAVLPLTKLRLCTTPCSVFVPNSFLVLAHVSNLYWPLVLAPCYLTFGPWFIGELLTGSLGVVFVWGSIVRGAYLPTATTWLYGIYHLVGIHFPLVIISASILQFRLWQISSGRCQTVLSLLLRHGLMVPLVLTQVYLIHSLHLAYGVWSVILGPFRTGYLLLTLFLWVQCCTLSLPDLTVCLQGKHRKLQSYQ